MINIEHWDSFFGILNEDNMRKKLELEGYSVNIYYYPKGTYFPNHTHSYDKKDGVLKGRFLIKACGKECLLEAGDILTIPANTVHSAEVIGNDTVISLDASKW
ncbi:MAG: cupin domain-containing protein [Acidobacteria bacterium]|nr:cupin domain-containing protein [Acidobacteriota bacterium]